MKIQANKIQHTIEPCVITPSITFCGFTVKGISADKVHSADLEVTVPLLSGLYRLPAPGQEAQVIVGKRTIATIKLSLLKKEGKLCINGAEIKFSRSITVTNPSSAFPEPSQKSHLISMPVVQDFFGDVGLKRVTVTDAGEIQVDGKILVFGHKLDSLAHRLAGRLPKIDVTNGQAIYPENYVVNASNNFDLAQFLKKIGGMTDSGDYRLSLCAESSAIGFESSMIEATSDSKQIFLSSGGICKIAENGGLSIDIIKDRTHVSSGAGNMDGFGHLEVTGLDDFQHCKVNGDIKFSAIPGKINAMSQYSVPMPVALKGVGANDLPIPVAVPLALHGENNSISGNIKFCASKDKFEIDESSSFNISLQAKLPNRFSISAPIGRVSVEDAKMTIAAQGNFGFKEGNLSITNGSGKIEGLLARPGFEAYNLKCQLDGAGMLSVDVDEFIYNSFNKFPSIKGRVNTRYEMSDNAQKKYPSFMPYENSVAFKLKTDGMLSAQPWKRSITDFLPDQTNFVGNPGRIVSAVGHRAGKIGSEALKKHIEKLTGTKVSENNKVTLLGEGKDSFKQRLEMIKAAEKTVLLQTFTFKSDKCGTEIANALIEAVKRGVKVFVIVDSLGNIGTAGDLLMESRIYSMLKDGGVVVKKYNSFLEEGLHEIVSVVMGDNERWDLLSQKNLENPVAAAHSFLTKLLNIASGQEESNLPEADRKAITQGLGKILGKEVDANPRAIVSEIAHALSAPIFDLNDLIILVDPFLKANRHLHEKYLVVDGKKAIMGGMNIADEYLKGGTGEKVSLFGAERTAWKDIDVMIEGAGAHDAHACFARNWKSLTGEIVPEIPVVEVEGGTAEVQVIQHRAMMDGDHNILNTLIEHFKALDRGDKVYIEIAYVLPSGPLEHLKASMLDACKRGADIRILTNGSNSIDVPFFNQASIFDVREMLQGGIRFFLRADDRMVHSKSFCFAGKVGMIGSWNMENRAPSADSEDLVVVYNTEFAKILKNHIKNDMKDENVKEIKFWDIASLPIKQEIQNSACSLFKKLM